MNRPTRTRLPSAKATTLLLLAAVAVLGFAPTPTAAQAKTTLLVQDSIFLSPTGDARYTRRVPLPPQDYLALRKANRPAPVLARILGLDVPDWLDAEQLRVFWDDPANTIQLRWNVAGLARLDQAQTWEVALQLPGAKLVSVQDQTVTLTGVGHLGPIPTLRAVRIVLPDGGAEARLSANAGRLSYRLSPPAGNGANASAQARLEAKSHLLGCLAPLYSQPKLGLWGGRLVFKNTGDQTLRDYRVRFQVVGYSPDWGPWQRCPVVAPGQTVVDPCFPVLDMEKVTQLSGARSVYLKAQYQYRKADGGLVEETESVRLQLLGRNLIEYGSKSSQQCATWEETSDLEPFIMASLVTYLDPAIQQLAGRLCHQLGGANATGSQKDAEKYMTALFDFMGAYISYQTPPGATVEGRMRQHVKFGRDVLANHAGTCIDLAILFASACETVGLEPLMISIPGHTFTAVRWHDQAKKTTATYYVETTLIGRAKFADAVKVGKAKFEEVVAKKMPRMVTEIKKMREAGLQSLELPPVADDWLAKICPPGGGRPQPPAAPATGNLVGTWRTVYRTGDLTITQTVALKADGTVVGVAVDQNGQRVVLQGTYRYADSVLRVNTNVGVLQGTVAWLDANRLSYVSDSGLRLLYTRIR